jgi:hypothetical protein
LRNRVAIFADFKHRLGWFKDILRRIWLFQIKPTPLGLILCLWPFHRHVFLVETPISVFTLLPTPLLEHLCASLVRV